MQESSAADPRQPPPQLVKRTGKADAQITHIIEKPGRVIAIIPLHPWRGFAFLGAFFSAPPFIGFSLYLIIASLSPATLGVPQHDASDLRRHVKQVRHSP